MAAVDPVERGPSSREYRDTVGMFATGVTILTARAGAAVHGMTANAFASVSLDPLLVLVCVERDAVMHRVLGAADGFAVTVLAADQERLARRFADSGRPIGVAQFDGMAWRPGRATGAPLLGGALAWLECATHEVLDGGDHSIFLGRVLTVERRAERGQPLLYFGGAYHRLGPA